MTIQNIFNLIGLVINMTGAYTMYHYSPKIDSRLFMFSEDEYKKMHQKDIYKNKKIRNGMLLLFAGFFLQFVALFL